VAKKDVFQACTANVEKVKPLTLRVHCKVTRRRHAVWFGPVAIE
jgi:hypothetical protein